MTKSPEMKLLRRFFALLVVILIGSGARGQQFSKADQALIANYFLTTEEISKYMDFEKGFNAAKAAEPKYNSIAPSNTLDGKIDQLSQMPSIVNLINMVASITIISLLPQVANKRMVSLSIASPDASLPGLFHLRCVI